MKNKKVKTLNTRNTTAKVKMDKKVAKFIMALNIIATSIIVYAIYKLKLLPFKYNASFIALFVVVAILLSLWLLKSKGYAPKIVTLVITIAILLSVPSLNKFSDFISKVTGANDATHVVNVVVLKDSPYKSISDFKNKDVYFGANTGMDEKNANFARQEISEKNGIDIGLREFNEYQTLTTDFYNGKVEALLLTEAHNAFIEEIKPDFLEETRIIATYSYTEEVDLPTHKVNVNTDTYSVFVTGIDTYGKINTVSRSDVNMVMTVNPITHQILLTSIPRDYHVVLHSKGKKDKLTHAGIYGVMESVKTLEDLFSEQVEDRVVIDYYLRVNFTSVEHIVDALGGVEVESLYKFKAWNGTKFEKGTNHVNGKQALSFVRERKSLPNGDGDRIRHQQALITGVIQKSTSPAILKNYNKFLSAVSDSFELSMTENELNAIIRKQIDTMPEWEIIDIQLDGKGAKSTTTYSMPGWNLYVNEPNYDSVKAAAKMIDKMEKGERISKEADWHYKK